jgi:chemotaxis protein histidine kinase CheA
MVAIKGTGLSFTGTNKFASLAYALFKKEHAPSADASMTFAKAAMEHDSVSGVGEQKIQSGGHSFVALVLRAKKKSKFDKPVIYDALLKSGLNGREVGYGLLVGASGRFEKGPLVCIRGEIFLIRPGPQPEKVAKAPPKKRKASEEEEAPQSTSGSTCGGSSSSSTKSGTQKAKRKAPRKRQAEQVHPQRTSDSSSSSSSSTRTQKKQKASYTPDDTAAKYAAAAQSEQDEALAELQTAQQEKSALDAHADQLSTENADLKAKLSAAEDDLSTVRTSTTEQLSGVNAELNTVKAALEFAETELGQKAAAMTELGEQVRNVNTMLKETLSDEVSNAWSNFCVRHCWCMLDTFYIGVCTCTVFSFAVHIA